MNLAFNGTTGVTFVSFHPIVDNLVFRTTVTIGHSVHNCATNLSQTWLRSQRLTRELTREGVIGYLAIFNRGCDRCKCLFGWVQALMAWHLAIWIPSTTNSLGFSTSRVNRLGIRQKYHHWEDGQKDDLVHCFCSFLNCLWITLLF